MEREEAISADQAKGRLPRWRVPFLTDAEIPAKGTDKRYQRSLARLFRFDTSSSFLTAE